MAKRNAKPTAKQADNTPKDASPRNGQVPPVETRWKPGQPSPNPNGRPRKIQELKDLILDTLAEDIATTDPTTGHRLTLTRAQAMIRTMLIKSPSDRMALLEYAFGKVPQPTHELTSDEWREWLKVNYGYTDSDIDSLVNEFAASIRPRRVGSGSDSQIENKSMAESTNERRDE